MKVYLLIEWCADESNVLAVFGSRSRARAQKSIGEVAALRDLEKHNQYCLEHGKSHWTMDKPLESYRIRKMEVLP